jgi:hypothetical protein
MHDLVTDTLLEEYKNIIAHLDPDATDDQIIQLLIDRADWTKEGAHAILMLARTYGTAILRNALALADAMGVEDGSSRL